MEPMAQPSSLPCASHEERWAALRYLAGLAPFFSLLLWPSPMTYTTDFTVQGSGGEPGNSMQAPCDGNSGPASAHWDCMLLEGSACHRQQALRVLTARHHH